MTATEFDTSLRELLNQEPFRPFDVEYVDGRSFRVDGPYVAFARGGASFLGPNHRIHFFDCKNVKQFVRPMTEAQA